VVVDLLHCQLLLLLRSELAVKLGLSLSSFLHAAAFSLLLREVVALVDAVVGLEELESKLLCGGDALGGGARGGGGRRGRG
jgi:hypothetical protein